MSGTCRSVETLSGRAVFASFLAFGLSDVVQSYLGRGAARFHFIDEGFGSLDTDTLDTAMHVRSSIRQSGRVVGIISRFGTAKPHPDDDPHLEDRFGPPQQKVIAED